MPTFSGLDIFWNFLIFLLVIALLVATLFFLKKLNPSLGKGEGKNIRFVESYDLGARQKIILLEEMRAIGSWMISGMRFGVSRINFRFLVLLR